ncbi:DUF6348 family protein [Hymenobacter perfusus]|uniref:Uncharacterized protein n=1 Tax=Hymenobacter perfusus TaxID=1236770 RepID=A0A3R9MYY4_9BACT|nr:DUF6348 family protein [Hymenobacter perfusus]RSK44168.1 hypothetical protein EI293_06405 [Hymenobacter perfusus]
MAFLSDWLKRLTRPAATPNQAQISEASEAVYPSESEQAQLLAVTQTTIEQYYSDIEATPQGHQLLLRPCELRVEVRILSRNVYPAAVVECQSFHLYHPRLFPGGLLDRLSGIGRSVTEAAENGARLWADGALEVALQVLENRPDPALNFTVPAVGPGSERWHQFLGRVHVQGGWQSRLPEVHPGYFSQILLPVLRVQTNLPPVSWLKVYVARQPDNSLLVDCLLNNELWPEALPLLEEAAQKWPGSGEFMAQRQYLAFRQCGLGLNSNPVPPAVER